MDLKQSELSRLRQKHQLQFQVERLGANVDQLVLKGSFESA